jgi:hypothetical protein
LAQVARSVIVWALRGRSQQKLKIDVVIVAQ